MLRSLSIEPELRVETLGSASFFTLSCRELSPEELSFLAGHSSLCFLAENRGGALYPLPVSSPDLFPEDLPEILKYKGKTNPVFTRMMLNTALSLSSFHSAREPLTVLDPLCGRGTTLFCALCMGMNAVGIDMDRRDLKESADYFSRYLKNAGWKHSLRAFSSTVENRGIPGKAFSFAPSREARDAGGGRTLTLYEGDTALAPFLLRKEKAHLLVADLPYGVQHAPQAGAGAESFAAFLKRVLPAWRKALRPGACLALSFNTLTLKEEAVRRALSEAGFLVHQDPLFSGLAHPVEQAVLRSLVFASLPPS